MASPTPARVSARAASVSESATLAIDAKAKALKAAGEDVIGFGAGEPDFPTPEHIVEAAASACRDPRNHRYTPTAGLPELRQAIAAKTARDSGFQVTPAQILVTNGGKQAVEEAFATLLDPGDEVLLPAPYWTTYPEVVRLAGGVPVAVPTTAESGYKVTVEQLERALTSRTKVLLFVSPSNPTGAVYDETETRALATWAQERGLWVVTDEIYEHLVYGGAVAHSMPVLVPELTERCVVVNGVAKTYAMTGWRVGWLIGPADVVRAATNLQSHSTSNVGNVAQRAAIAALEGPLDDVEKMRSVYDRRWLHMSRAGGRFLRLPQFRPPPGTASRPRREGGGHHPRPGGTGLGRSQSGFRTR
jgi:aspartate aminotransferase